MMVKKVVILSLVFGALHFGLSILALFKGLIIFRGPSTAGEFFWSGLMTVLLFPADVFFPRSGNQWAQTFALVLNSAIWGIVLAILYLGLRRLYPGKSTPKI